jgi:Uma2 family endonuclease
MTIERINGVPTGQIGRPHREVWILQRLRRAILESLDGQPERGFLFGWVGYRLLNGVQFDPVLSYILNEYLYPIHDELQFAPELAVEFISDSSNFLDLRDRVASYLNNGTKLVWFVYPYKREIAAFSLGDGSEIACEIHGISDMLTGDDVLPGFSVAVADIFPK